MQQNSKSPPLQPNTPEIMNLRKEIEELNEVIRQNDEEFSLEIQVILIGCRDTTTPSTTYRKPSGNMKLDWIRFESTKWSSPTSNTKSSG